MFQGLLLIAASFVLIKWREKIVELVGKIPWAEQKLGRGGTYTLMVLIAILCFILGVALLTGTTDVLFSPLKRFAGEGVM
jgi:hypothetical protein